MSERFIDKVVSKIELKTGQFHFHMSLWGSDVSDTFIQSIEFSNYGENFTPFRGDIDESTDVILILGALNKKSISVLKDQLKNIKVNYHIVHALGASNKELLVNSYNSINVADYLKIDLTILNYPYSISDLLESIKELKLGHHE